MAKSHKSMGEGEGEGPVNQHKRMAMGDKVTGMKNGGAVKATKKEMPKKKK